MTGRLRQLYEAMDQRDLIEIGVLAVAIYGILRFLGQTRGSGLMRGLGLVVVGFFLVGQLLIATFDLAELAKPLDTLMTAAFVGLLVIFQPELRRGLMVLGRHRWLNPFEARPGGPVADTLSTAALALSRDRVGALVAIQRSTSLAPFIETGERLDAEVSPPLLRALFHHESPLHDGAVVLCNGRLAAAGCQLPLAQPGDTTPSYGMRHRAAVGLSEETDALILVVSEETGRISLAARGRLEPVPRENLCRRLAAELCPPPVPRLKLRFGGLRRLPRLTA